MNTVEKLLNTALSTNSEEEAMTAFRLARKKNAGKTRTQETQPKAAGKDWEAIARKYHRIAADRAYDLSYRENEVMNLRANIAETKVKLKVAKESVATWQGAFWFMTVICCTLIIALVA